MQNMLRMRARLLIVVFLFWMLALHDVCLADVLRSTPRHNSDDIAAKPRSIAPIAVQDPRITFIQDKLKSGDPESNISSFRMARQYSGGDEQRAQEFDGARPGISRFLVMPTLQLVDLANNSKDPAEKVNAALGAASVIEDWKSGMRDSSLNIPSFLSASESAQKAYLDRMDRDPSQQAKLKKLGEEFGRLLKGRFDLGALPGEPDKDASDSLKNLWALARKITSGELKPSNAFELAILAAWQEGKPNRIAFWKSVAEAKRTANADVLSNWQDELPDFIENMKVSEQNRIRVGKMDDKQFNEARQGILDLFKVRSLSDIDTSGDPEKLMQRLSKRLTENR